MEAYEELKRLVDAAEEDIQKAEGGNRAAGTRARKAMQEVKAAAQSVRVALLEKRDQAEGSASQGGPSDGGPMGGGPGAGGPAGV